MTPEERRLMHEQMRHHEQFEHAMQMREMAHEEMLRLQQFERNQRDRDILDMVEVGGTWMVPEDVRKLVTGD